MELRPFGRKCRQTWPAGQGGTDPELDSEGHLVVSGLQVLELGEVDGQPLITTLASYRDPALAIRCGLPPRL